MAIIDSLAINLTANTKAFVAKMNGATSTMKGLLSTVGGVITKMGLLSGVLSLFSGLKLKEIFSNAFKEADRFGKLADEIGTTVNDLYALEHAAKITGTTFSVLTKGLQIMNRRIGEAKKGYGEASKGVRNLGLNIDELARMSAFEQFATIGDAINKLGTQAEKSAGAFSFFSEQGQLLLNTFQLGREGLEKMREENEKLMGSFSRDEFRIFEAMNDSIERLGKALRGFALRVGREFAKYFTGSVTAVTEVFERLRLQVIPNLASSIRNMMSRFLSAISEVSTVLAGLYQVLSSVTQVTGELFDSALTSTKTWMVVVGNLTEEFTKLVDYGAQFLGYSEAFESSIEDSRSAMQTLGESMIGVATLVEFLPQAMNLAVDGIWVSVNWLRNRIETSFFPALATGGRRIAATWWLAFLSLNTPLTIIGSSLIKQFVRFTGAVQQFLGFLFQIFDALKAHAETTFELAFLSLKSLKDRLLGDGTDKYDLDISAAKSRLDRIAKRRKEISEDIAKFVLLMTPGGFKGGLEDIGSAVVEQVDRLKQAKDDFLAAWREGDADPWAESASLSLKEALSTSGIQEETETLLNKMLDDFNAKLGRNNELSKELREFILKIQTFKLDPVVIDPSPEAEDLTKTLNRFMEFSGAQTFGSQAAWETINRTLSAAPKAMAAAIPKAIAPDNIFAAPKAMAAAIPKAIAPDNIFPEQVGLPGGKDDKQVKLMETSNSHLKQMLEVLKKTSRDVGPELIEVQF